MGCRAAAAACLRQPGHLPRGGATARAHQARLVLRRRRFTFTHWRGLRRLHVRHWRHRDAGCDGDRADLAAGATHPVHAVGRCAGRRRQRQGHDAGDDRPPGHERWPVPGRRVLRRRGAELEHAGAHDTGQHERRAGRAGGAGGARPHHPPVAAGAWRGRGRRHALVQRRGRAGQPPQLRRLRAGTASGIAAQPRQQLRRGFAGADPRAGGLYRRLHRRQAGRPARGCARAGRPTGG